jgi:hypothetical protein
MDKKTFESLKTFSENSFVRKRIWQTDKLHCNMYCFEPGQQNSLHRHPISDEVVFCLEGGRDCCRWHRASVHQSWRNRVGPDEHPPWIHQYEPEPPHDHQRHSMPAPGRACAGRTR